MDKITYLAELAEGLARWVPERERQDILRFYAEYFEEAGLERETEVVAELGDPWTLSSRLAVEGGYVAREKAAAWKPKKRWPKVLLGTAVGLSIFALVAGIGLLVFNVVQTASGFVQVPVLGEIEQVTLVDPVTWDSEFGIGCAYYDADSVEGITFIDGENAASFGSIDVDISLGSVEVVAGDSFTLSVQRGEALRDYDLTWEVRNGTLVLRDSSRSHWGVTSWGTWNVAVTVTVPGNTVLNKISVKTGLGDVLLYGVNAKTVTAETGLGDVECYEARNVGRLELTTGMGDVNLGLEVACDGLSIHLESGMGHIEAALCGFETDYSYTLESGLGAVTVNGVYRGNEAERRDSAPCQLSAESGMGDVSVYFNC